MQNFSIPYYILYQTIDYILLLFVNDINNIYSLMIVYKTRHNYIY